MLWRVQKLLYGCSGLRLGNWSLQWWNMWFFLKKVDGGAPVSYTHLTLPTNMCFFTESSRWSPLFRRPSTCYIRKHLTHSSYCSLDFVLCMRVICRMWARLRSSLWEKDDFPSSKPPIASAMISNLSNNGFLLCAVFFSMLTAVWPSLWRVRVVFLCSLLVKKYLGKDT